MAAPDRSPAFADAARSAGAVSIADVPTTALRWLWPGRIPLGRVTLLVSDPGLGKSLLTLDVAARVSRGAPWPDVSVGGNAEVIAPPSPQSPAPSSSVLLLSAEDAIADTIRPRLEAMNADCTRILAITAIAGDESGFKTCSFGGPDTNPAPRAFDLTRDLARLAKLVAAMPDCRLIVIDPISAYLGDTSEHANSEIQRLMLPLANLAREHNVAVLAVSHLRKKDGAAIYRTMGSLAFVAAARAAWVISKDPDDPRRRLLLPLKNNIAPDTTGLSFTIEQLAPDGPPVIRWSPQTIPVTAESVVGNARRPGRPDEERQAAVKWLRQVLSKGPRLSTDVRTSAAEHGFNLRTLTRAFRDLDGQAFRTGFGLLGEWSWKLPTIEGQNPEGEFCPSMQFLDPFATFDQAIHEYEHASQSM